MMYLLDFDRTLFDTEAFAQYLRQRPDFADFVESPEDSLVSFLEGLAKANDTLFSPGELSRFLYPDVPEFLRMAGNEALIVTYGHPALQKLKVENALVGIPRVSALYTGSVRKGDFLKDRIQAYGAKVLCVDDKIVELESMTEKCPSVSLYEIRRDGGAGDGRWPVIHSLTELP